MKKLILVLALGLVLGMMSTASAAIVTASGTGDNWLWAWDGTVWTQGTNFSNWRYTDSLNFTVSLGEPLGLYFAVMNEKRTDSAANPAGFLGQLTTDSGFFKETGTNKLLTDTTHWQVAVVPYETWVRTPPTPKEGQSTTAPIFNPTTATLTWITPTSYGSNSHNSSSWGWDWSNLSAVDNSALWLWTANQWNKTTGQTGMDYLVVFRTTATVVPEPTSMLLLGMGILGLFGFRRKVLV